MMGAPSGSSQSSRSIVDMAPVLGVRDMPDAVAGFARAARRGPRFLGMLSAAGAGGLLLTRGAALHADALFRAPLWAVNLVLSGYGVLGKVAACLGIALTGATLATAWTLVPRVPAHMEAAEILASPGFMLAAAAGLMGSSYGISAQRYRAVADAGFALLHPVQMASER